MLNQIVSISFYGLLDLTSGVHGRQQIQTH